MESRCPLVTCPPLPPEVRARHWCWPDELYETAARGAGAMDRQMRLWLHLADGRVLALRLAALEAPDDSAIAPVVNALASDLRGERQGLELSEVGYVHVLYAAPVAPPPAICAWNGRIQGRLSWTAGLDAEVLDTLSKLYSERFYLSVRNYNRLAALPPERRLRRLQALQRFSALVAPILLTAHRHPNCFDGERHAWRQADPEVEAAIDQGRDLVGALARHYGISRGLVRAAVNADYWDMPDEMRRSVLAMLDALPANKRPPNAMALMREREGLVNYLLLPGDDEADASLLPCQRQAHARAFLFGWEATWQKLRRRYWPLPQHLADARDFLAAVEREAVALTWRRDGVSWRNLTLAWIAQHGLTGLLRDSARWHTWQAQQKKASDIAFTLPAIVGTWQAAGCTARELLSAQDLIDEGASMHHCVGSYWERCLAGERIFALTDAQERRATAQYQPRVTIYPTPDVVYQLVQLRGPCNQPVGKRLARFARRLAQVLNEPERRAAREAALAVSHAGRQPGRGAFRPSLPALDVTSRARLIPVLSHLGLEPAAPGTLLIAYVAGYAYHDGPRLEAQGRNSFASGDILTLEREPDNPHDPLAVRILWQGAHLGYVPRADNELIAHRLDRGEPLVCRLLRYEPAAAAWRKIEFVITEGE